MGEIDDELTKPKLNAAKSCGTKQRYAYKPDAVPAARRLSKKKLWKGERLSLRFLRRIPYRLPAGHRTEAAARPLTLRGLAPLRPDEAQRILACESWGRYGGEAGDDGDDDQQAT